MSESPATGGAPAKPFHKRGWIVFVIGCSAVVLLISGIVLFIAPSGRIARSIGWAPLWLDRDGWVNLHNAFAILFVAGLIWHLVFNWKPLRNYVVSRATHHLNLEREILLALAMTLVLIVLIAVDMPPVDRLSDLANYFRHQFWK